MTYDPGLQNIHYQDIVQDALLTVVGRALKVVEQNDSILPGNHHFYISFKTGAEGVEVPQKLRAKYKDEMTIVLQNRFSNLQVGEKSFSVTLFFGGMPSPITVPYQAITAFIDPSEDFSLQFKVNTVNEDDAETPEEDGGADDDNVISIDFKKR